MAYGRWIGAIAGVLIWSLVVQPFFAGNFDMPIELRILISGASLLVLLFAGLLLGQAIERCIRRI